MTFTYKRNEKNRWRSITRKHLIYSGLSAFILWLTTYSVFGTRGLLAKYALEQSLNEIKEVNSELEQVNNQLQDTIKNIKKDKRYFEQYVRSKTNLVRENEMIYQFKDGELNNSKK